MADTSSFTKFVPGFDFLQNLVKNAGSAMPSMGQWVVPTLDPEALERRIDELRTVQFWLDQNSRMLGTTIQALEVQRMTLSALKGMNVTVTEMHEALQARAPASPPVSARAPEPAPAPPAAAAPSPTVTEPPAAVVDAMQWWGALTEQFTKIASQAVQAAAQAVPEHPAAVAPAATKPATTRAASPKAAQAAPTTAQSASSPRKATPRKRAAPKAKPAAST